MVSHLSTINFDYFSLETLSIIQLWTLFFLSFAFSHDFWLTFFFLFHSFCKIDFANLFLRFCHWSSKLRGKLLAQLSSVLWYPHKTLFRSSEKCGKTIFHVFQQRFKNQLVCLELRFRLRVCTRYSKTLAGEKRKNIEVEREKMSEKTLGTTWWRPACDVNK